MNETSVLVTQINSLIGSCIGALIENYIIVDFLVSYFGYKKGKNYYHVASVLIWILLSAISQANGRFPGSTYILPIFAIFLLVSYCHTFLNGKIANQLLCCLTPFIIIAVLNTLVLLLSSLYLQVDAEIVLNSTDAVGIIIMIFTKLLFYICMQIFINFFGKKYVNLKKSHWVTVAIVLLVSFLINIGLYYLAATFNFRNMKGIILVGIAVGILVMDVYVYQSILDISKQNYQVLKYNLLQLQNEEQGYRIKALAENEDKLAKLRHDFKNHLMSIQVLITDGAYHEAEEYIQNLTEKYLKEAQLLKICNNLAINAVLISKEVLCKENGIACDYYVVGDYLDVDSVDLCIALFNLLDNAIEASLKLKDKRCIYLKMTKEKEYIVLLIKNRIPDSVLGKNPQLETTKNNREKHGLGHMSVEDVVHKNDGMIKYYEENDMFCVYLMLKLSSMKR